MAELEITRYPEYPFGLVAWTVSGLTVPRYDDTGGTRAGKWLRPAYNSSNENTGGDYYHAIITTWDHGDSGNWDNIDIADRIVYIPAPITNNGNTNGIKFTHTLSAGVNMESSYTEKAGGANEYYTYDIIGMGDRESYYIRDGFLGFIMGVPTNIYIYCICPTGKVVDGEPTSTSYFKAYNDYVKSITITYPNNFYKYIEVQSTSMKHSRSTSSGGSYTVTVPIKQTEIDTESSSGRGYIDSRYYSKFGLTTLVPDNGSYGYQCNRPNIPDSNPYDYSVCSTTVNDSDGSTSISLSLPVSSDMYGKSKTFYPYLQTANLGVPTTKPQKGWYYALKSIEITFDNYSYSADIEIDDIRHNGVTIQMTGLNSTVNLNEYYYISTADASSGMTISLSNPTTGNRSGENGKTVNVEGLTPNANNTRYVYVRSTATKIYYKVARFRVQTDAASYSCNLSATLSKPFEATISASSISPLTNLDGYWYLSDTKLNSGTYYLDDSERVSGTRSGSSGQGITFTGLTPGATYTKHAYVRSSASSRYYYMESITFTAFGASVNVWDEENQEWNTHISTVKAEDGSFKYCEGKVWDKTNNKWRDF